MKLSHRGLLAVSLSMGMCAAATARAESPQLPLSTVNEHWEESLERRIERTLPRLMSSLAEARREGDDPLIRCFDRAVTGLNSVQRQVSYHADLRYQASAAKERLRHAKALLLLSERVEELAHTVETCFTDGLPVKSGQTVVEVIVDVK